MRTVGDNAVAANVADSDSVLCTLEYCTMLHR